MSDWPRLQALVDSPDVATWIEVSSQDVADMLDTIEQLRATVASRNDEINAWMDEHKKGMERIAELEQLVYDAHDCNQWRKFDDAGMLGPCPICKEFGAAQGDKQ